VDCNEHVNGFFHLDADRASDRNVYGYTDEYIHVDINTYTYKDIDTYGYF
jgi:hypothetical protein